MIRFLGARKIRFAFVGVANTLFNFLILNVAFYAFHSSKIMASIIATSIAIVLSFFLNRSFVFKHRSTSWRQPVMFILVTVSGVLLIQNSFYAISLYILQPHVAGITLLINGLGFKVSKDFLQINISNLIGSIFGMFWNYNGYRLLVFNGDKEEVIEEIKIVS